MSLMIDVDLVEAVLLADGWHPVADDSFTLSAYEFVWWSSAQNKKKDEPTMLHSSGNASVASTGFSFHDRADILTSGPLTAIQAVRHRRK
jgi:hypothetical protein